jgi:hypothetical protein
MARYVLASLALGFPYPQVQAKQQFSPHSLLKSLLQTRLEPLVP